MAPQIGFPGLAPRSRAHLCFTMVEGSNRRREGGDVSRGFRVSRATDWQGPIGFFVASPFPTWRRTHFPSTLNSCPGSVKVRTWTNKGLWLCSPKPVELLTGCACPWRDLLCGVTPLPCAPARFAAGRCLGLASIVGPGHVHLNFLGDYPGDTPSCQPSRMAAIATCHHHDNVVG